MPGIIAQSKYRMLTSDSGQESYARKGSHSLRLYYYTNNGVDAVFILKKLMGQKSDI